MNEVLVKEVFFGDPRWPFARLRRPWGAVEDTGDVAFAIVSEERTSVCSQTVWRDLSVQVSSKAFLLWPSPRAFS